MKCREFKGILSLLAQGELDGDARLAAERHARECPGCAGLLGETLTLRDAARWAARRDETMATALLEGFEDRLLERRRRTRQAEALAPERPRHGGAGRLAFGLSLGFNLCTVAALLLILFVPRAGTRLLGDPLRVRTLPAGMPSEARMRQVFAEVENFYGRRLNWVSESGGQMALGITHDLDQVPPQRPGDEPLVALVYWLDAEGSPNEGGHPSPVVILTRSGREIRQRVPLGPGHPPIDIAVNSFHPRHGKYAIQTQVRPMEPVGKTPESVSSLAAAVSVAPGKPTKLGEVRLGNRVYNTFLAVQELGGAKGNGKDS